MRSSSLKIGLALVLAAAFWLIGQSFLDRRQKIVVRGYEFRVEMAETGQKRELGLGERDSLCQKCGMVFVFPENGRHSFWMKGMRFPLDIIWFDSADGKIVHLEKNVSADSERILVPSAPTDRVLEINGGLAEEYGIQKGDRVVSVE